MTFRLGLQFSNGVQGIQLFASTQLFKRSPCSLHLGSLGNLMTLIFVKYHKHAGVKVLCLSFCPFRFDSWRCRWTYRVKSYGHFVVYSQIWFCSYTQLFDYKSSFWLFQLHHKETLKNKVCLFSGCVWLFFHIFGNWELHLLCENRRKKKAIFYHNSTKLNADTSCFYSSFIFYLCITE